MRVLMIGGSGMTGPFVVQNLVAVRHEAWLLHRSHSDSAQLAGAVRIREELGYSETVSPNESLVRAVVWERNNPSRFEKREEEYAAEDGAVNAD
jgi:hypothetical protein